jgi:hypothetical protein
MVENLADLHVLGVTDDGKVWHTLRSPGGWSAFAQVPNLPDAAVDVACVRCLSYSSEPPHAEGLWVLIAFANTPPQLRFRDSVTSTSQWKTIPGNILPLPIASRVAVTVSAGDVPPNEPNAGSPRAYVHMAVIANGILPQDRGRLIAAIMPNRGAGGRPSPIVEVQTSGAGDLGRAQAVALAPASTITPRPPGQESVASLAAVFPDPDGALFFTQGGASASLPSGQWEPFRARDLTPPGGPGARPGVVEDVALAQGQANPTVTDRNDYMAISRGGGDTDVYGATLSPSGWSAWENYEVFKILSLAFDTEPGNLRHVTISKTTEGLHVVAVPQNGQLLHQLRPPTMPGAAIFRDVEQVGVGTEVGFFVAAACG